MSDKRAEIWATLDAGLTKWMSKAYESGKQDERERIIKLLEPLAIHAPNCFYEQHNWPEDCDANAVRKVIALIKGENK